LASHPPPHNVISPQCTCYIAWRKKHVQEQTFCTANYALRKKMEKKFNIKCPKYHHKNVQCVSRITDAVEK
jgi:hypothetical protein